MTEREVGGQIRKAAKRAGYDPREIETLLNNPETVFEKGERAKLRFTMAAADAFVQIMQGGKIDHRQLVRFANQLRDIADAPTDDEKLAAWRKTHDVFDDEWGEPEGEKLEIDFTFEEEQKLLLVKNLLEEAFFRGDLAQLTGESAGAVAFFANRLSKVVGRMTPDVQGDFGFNAKRFDRLMNDAVGYYDMHYGHRDTRESIAAEEKAIIDEIFTVDDPRVVRYQELKKSEGKSVGWEVKRLEPEYIAKLKDGAGLLLLQFDTIVPSKIPNAAKVKELLKKSYAGVSDASIAKNAMIILGYEDVCPAYAFSNARGGSQYRSRDKWTLDAAVKKSDADKKLLQNFIDELQNVTGKQKKMVDALVDFIKRMVKDPDGELGALCMQGRLYEANERERNELYATIVKNPMNSELVKKLEDVKKRKDAIWSDGDADIVNTLSRAELAIRMARKSEKPGEFSLYFIKDYMVAVDKFAREGYMPTDYFVGNYHSGKSIATHSFSGEGSRGLFSDVHYREEFLPVAEAIVAMQKAERD